MSLNILIEFFTPLEANYHRLIISILDFDGLLHFQSLFQYEKLNQRCSSSLVYQWYNHHYLRTLCFHFLLLLGAPKQVAIFISSTFSFRYLCR